MSGGVRSKVVVRLIRIYQSNFIILTEKYRFSNIRYQIVVNFFFGYNYYFVILFSRFKLVQVFQSTPV